MTQDYIGKCVLVDIVEYDGQMRVRRSRNFLGTVVSVTEGSIELRRSDTGIIETLVASVDDLDPAEAGEYWLRSTGESAEPDFLAEWTAIDEG